VEENKTFVLNIMLTNEGVWSYYQPGFVHSAYVPYLRVKDTDAWGNKVEINTWEEQGPKSMVQPELVRINQGLRFQKMFEEDPCPVGFTKDPNNLGYCQVAPLRHEPVFYTDKSFIAKKQYWQGPGDPSQAKGELNRNENFREISEQTDMRSVNPITGQYQVVYHPVLSSAKPRYTNPTPGPEKYDATWNLARQSGYASMATKYSYLG
jgi:hypothetical protein